LRYVAVVEVAKCKFRERERESGFPSYQTPPPPPPPHTNRNNKVSTAQGSARATNSEQATKMRKELKSSTHEEPKISPFFSY
jgi:hypothetical protein